MRRRFIKTAAIIVIITIFNMPLAKVVATETSTKIVNAGSAWEVSETTNLEDLTIMDGSVIKTPEGKNLTMTVDGVETPTAAGTYKGKIVLTPTEDIPISISGPEAGEKFNLRTAIYVDNGAIVPKKSVLSAAVGGEVTNTLAKNIKITSIGENFNGIIVTGDSKYFISNPVIKLTGNGDNDFAGIGAGIMSDGKADVTVNNAIIINHGVRRAAVVVRGNSTIHVNDSNIETYNGIKSQSAEKKSMMDDGPWVIGITGNVRATNMIGYGTAYYTNTHIKAQGWGVLSTDDTKKVRLYATKCTIETVESGYGSYSIGDCINTFSGCTFNVTDYALILANEAASGNFTDGTIVNSGRFGVMVHSGNYGKLVIDKGSVFNTNEAVIEVKSGYTDIIVDNAKLNSKNGIILQAMINDDPNMADGLGGMMFPGAPTGGAMPGNAGGSMFGGNSGSGEMLDGQGANRGGMPGTDVTGNAGTGGSITDGGTGMIPSIGSVTLSNKSDITATFKNMNMNGDIVNAMTSLGDVIVNFEKAKITGAITTATAAAVGKPSKENYKVIGKVINTYCATDDKHGLKVSLDAESTWIVGKTSYLTGLTIAKGAAVKAPEGYSVKMTIDGVIKEIEAGEYKGKIILTVVKF